MGKSAPPKSAEEADRVRTESKQPKQPKKPSASRSKKAGLMMPVSRINRHLKISKVMDRVGSSTPVYMAAVMEYVIAEVVEIAGNKVKKDGRKRLTPADVAYAIRTDRELNKLMEGYRFFCGDKVTKVTEAVTLEADRAVRANKVPAAVDA